ncbi:MAG: hypothetical protein EBS53_19335, partial [Bacteroidetes bacterium]|nr:hypothetical protein [Bacteroidota bacterium]
TSDPLERDLGLDKDPLSWEGLTEAAAQKTKELVEESAKESANRDLKRDERLKDLQKQAKNFEKEILNPNEDKFP